MESSDPKIPLPSSKLFRAARIITLLGSILVALSSGTNYIYSAYAPQLGARLRVSHTRLNIVGLAGNMGVYTCGPFWGRIVDRKGPRIPLMGACIFLLVGYLGIRQMYDDGIGDGVAVSALHFTLLVICAFMTGSGGNAGLGAAMNVTAKSFPSGARATTTGLVLSGFGLSAFWFSLLAHTLFPGDTSAFLLILALGTAIPMVLGLFIVKPVPLSPESAHPSHQDTAEGYGPVSSSDAVVIVGEAQVALDSEADMDAQTDSEPLLSHSQEVGPYEIAAGRSSIELASSAPHHDSDKDVVLPDIHGTRLWATPDFYLVFMIMGICSGTGLMYINNVGSIAQALYAKTHAVYDDVEASKWQAAQVSVLSIGNCAGRILIGLVSDFAHTRLRLPRAYCLCIVSSFFIISQAAALMVSSVETLWIATLLLGLAYGFLFGSYPSIMIDWFGMPHFAENWGYVSFSPVIGGNLFSLMFGLYLDAHARRGQNAHLSLSSRDLPSEHQCFDGKDCYLGCVQATLVACVVSLGLSWWAGIRDGQKMRGRSVRARA